jgi:hypothetical protein
MNITVVLQSLFIRNKGHIPYYQLSHISSYAVNVSALNTGTTVY